VKENKESRSYFVKSRKDSAVMLEESKTALDFVAFFVEVQVVFTLNDTVTFGWDNGFSSHAFDIGKDGVGVVSLVSQ
jgi:hypothetical protein